METLLTKDFSSTRGTSVPNYLGTMDIIPDCVSSTTYLVYNNNSLIVSILLGNETITLREDTRIASSILRF